MEADIKAKKQKNTEQNMMEDEEAMWLIQSSNSLSL